MDFQPSLNGSGIVDCSISIKALKDMIVNFLSYTLGRPFSDLMAVNHRSRNVRAIPGLLASIQCNAAAGLYKTQFINTSRFAKRNLLVFAESK